jgi:tetratricopeptide (TPR) repeat protein
MRRRGDDRIRALACFEESLKLNGLTGNLRGQAGAYLDIAETLRMLNKFGEAIKALRRSLHLQRQAESWLGEADTLESLIKVYLKSHPKRAEVFLNRSRVIYKMPEMKRYKRQWDELERWVKQRKQK